MMSLESVCTVRVPVYKQFTNLAIWPATHSVSSNQNRKHSEIGNCSRLTPPQKKRKKRKDYTLSSIEYLFVGKLAKTLRGCLNVHLLRSMIGNPPQPSLKNSKIKNSENAYIPHICTFYICF